MYNSLIVIFSVFIVFVVLMILQYSFFTKKSKFKLYEIQNFNNSNIELENIINEKNNITHVNALLNSDSFVSKMGIHKLLNDYYYNDKDMVDNIIPKSWNISNKLFNDSFFKNEKADTVFIAKKNIQQQKGILLFRKIQITPQFIKKLQDEKYVVIQEYLKNPFLIDQRKTNIRVYLLIVNKDNYNYIYIYNDGFMYYTPEKYEYGTNSDSNITTGYIDRKVYEINPLTLKDLRSYLIKNNYNDNILFDNIHRTIKYTMDGCISRLRPMSNSIISYQLFGVDLQFDKKLNVKVIEINKSPNLKPHDTGRDSALKSLLQQDITKIVTDEPCSNFELL